MTTVAAHKPKRFRLSFVGAMEDQPRLLRTYGRACGGEFALVMRPSEGRALMVFVTPSGSMAWQAGDEPPLGEGVVKAPAEVVGLTNGVRLRILAGPYSGHAFAPYEGLPTGVAVGDQVEVTFHPDDQFAHVQRAGAATGDAPRRPVREVAAKEAISAVKAEQKGLPAPGPITLRGQWAGVLHCTEAAQPQVELWRKLATYGTLRVTSDPVQGWAWRFERGEQWFSDPGTVGGQGLPTLSAAIEAGVLGAMKLVKEACSFRDTRRRAAHDAAYAQKHPIPEAKPAADPTEKLREPPPPKEKKPKAPRKAKKAEPAAPAADAPRVDALRGAAPPRPIEDKPLPEVPQDPDQLARLADTIERQGDALAAISGVSWLWEDQPTGASVQAWFEEQGHGDEADRIREYLARPEQPLDELIRTLVAGYTGDSDLDLEEARRAQPDDEVLERIEQLEAALRSAPALMERARRLIRYAASMTRSPRCQGKEQREAAEAVQRAVQTYESAREAILAGKQWDAARSMRRMGERVAMSAAKVARSCAAGQQSLTASIPEAYRGWHVGDRFALKDEPDKKGRILALLPEQRRVRVRWDRPVAGVEEQELQTGLMERPATDVLVGTPAPAPRTRKPKAQAAPAPEPTPSPSADVDPAKDKALLDAFSAAIAQAMGGGGP